MGGETGMKTVLSRRTYIDATWSRSLCISQSRGSTIRLSWNWNWSQSRSRCWLHKGMEPAEETGMTPMETARQIFLEYLSLPAADGQTFHAERRDVGARARQWLKTNVQQEGSAFNSGDLASAMCGANRIPQRGKL